MRYRTLNERGFTLLELLVTLVVLGLLMLTLTQGIRVGLQAWALEGRVGRRASGLETTDRALRQLIGQASPGEPRSRHAAFTGTAHTLSFVTTLPEGFGARVTHEADVRLLVTKGHRLELLWRPHYRRWIVPLPPPSAITLLDHVAQLDLGFWQPAAAPRRGRWLSAWTARELPPLVRLRIAFPPGNARQWPDIVIAPMRELPSP
ncbi:MAG TPA: prepilin-type N-terminal cleavage/methylation domain-containing protein [Acetobacteraceae bacterium]|nr:prepilin-type N-terminal cleavage/methylation domain-containing protein [Acetobacteraceae bacterium]